MGREISRSASWQNNTSAVNISLELQIVLQHIVDAVAFGLKDCVGAIVAPLEQGNELTIRAYSVNFAQELLHQLEQRLGVGFYSPKSKAYLDDQKFKDNLSVRAIKGVDGQPQKFVLSDSLYDLFRPVVNKPLSDLAQKLTGIKQVIAVPFFIEDEVVGNLFAATRTRFSERDIGFLTTFGHLAAVAIQNQRRLAEAQALEQAILALQASMTDETKVFQIIVDAVVQGLDYIGALVAPLEKGSELPVRAYAVSLGENLMEQLEQQLGLSFLSPKATAYLNDENFKDNLSVRAIKGVDGQPQKFIISDSLYDLFRPIINKPLSDLAQKLTGIKQVIVLPFFIEDEVVGNLLVATHRPRFTEREKEILMAFGQQAAMAIRNAWLYRTTEQLYQKTDLLYRKSDERREQAQIFAKLAFSAAAYAHALRNHIGAFRMYSQLIKPLIPTDSMRQLGVDVTERLNQAADILDNLHEPWREQPDTYTAVNLCLKRALSKIIPDRDELVASEGIAIHISLAENLPPIKTSPDMLTEACQVVLKNGLEAIREKNRSTGQGGNLWIESRRDNPITLQILVHDDGVGVKAEDLDKIFEMRWSTKEAGMGFGLFWTKDYIEGLNGKVTVESVWQEGATFCLTLPVSTQESNGP